MAFVTDRTSNRRAPRNPLDASAEGQLRAKIGNRIAEMRRQLGLSARRVAAELKISREAVTHIETGRNNITAVSLWKLAMLFDCDIADFFPDIPDGFELTKVDTRKIEEEGGEKAARWARVLFTSAVRRTSL